MCAVAAPPRRYLRRIPAAWRVSQRHLKRSQSLFSPHARKQSCQRSLAPTTLPTPTPHNPRYPGHQLLLSLLFAADPDELPGH